MRSYVYIVAHVLIARILQLFGVQYVFGKVGVFYGIRCVLALVSVLCELAFLRGVGTKFGKETRWTTALFLLVGSGMFQASTAYLPSSFAMYRFG